MLNRLSAPHPDRSISGLLLLTAFTLVHTLYILAAAEVYEGQNHSIESQEVTGSCTDSSDDTVVLLRCFFDINTFILNKLDCDL